MKNKQLQILQETKEYYEQDPIGRRCSDKGACYYDPKTIGKEHTSDGCAVGRLLTPELRERLDRENYGDTVRQVFEKLPTELQELGLKFLRDLQLFHDYPYFWNTEGLSERGKKAYKDFVEKVNSGYYLD